MLRRAYLRGRDPRFFDIGFDRVYNRISRKVLVHTYFRSDIYVTAR